LKKKKGEDKLLGVYEAMTGGRRREKAAWSKK